MFAWNRTNGKLLGDNGLQGPTFDHTQNENGKYQIKAQSIYFPFI